MNGYDSIRQLKQDLRASGVKVTVTDFLALAQNNDPFYAGAPAPTLKAQWFADLWEAFGFGHGVHIRRFHYRLVSQNTPPEKHDGTPYENTKACSAYLSSASKDARYLELVKSAFFVDRRNPDPKRFVGTEGYISEPYAELDPISWLLPRIDANLDTFGFIIPAPSACGYGYSLDDQPCHLELWVEKSTMNDVLIPVCKEIGCNLITSLGFQSITSVLGLIQRVLDAGKPARIFYISDFDPAGDGMPLAVARQVEYWIQKNSDLEIKLQPIALTMDQCIEYQLPRIPIKDEDRRKGNFETRFGEGATELDALEALHPGELATIVREAIAPYRDESLYSRLREADAQANESFHQAWDEITDPEQQQLDEIHAEIEEVTNQYQDQLMELSEQLREEMAPFNDRLEIVRHAIEEKTRYLDRYLIPRPEPETEWQDESGWLFDSNREYIDQLQHYKRHQGKALKDMCR